MALGDYSAQLIVCWVYDYLEYDSEQSLPWRMKFPAVTFWHSTAMQLYPVSDIIHDAMCVLVIKIFKVCWQTVLFDCWSCSRNCFWYWLGLS